MTGTRRRGLPEIVVFVSACLVVGAIASLMVIEAFGSFDPAAPAAARSGDVRIEGDQYFVPVVVENKGDATAAQVQVVAELTIGDTVTTGDQVIDFLAGHEVERITFAFDADPSTGELIIHVVGFTEP